MRTGKDLSHEKGVELWAAPFFFLKKNVTDRGGRSSPLDRRPDAGRGQVVHETSFQLQGGGRSSALAVWSRLLPG